MSQFDGWDPARGGGMQNAIFFIMGLIRKPHALCIAYSTLAVTGLSIFCHDMSIRKERASALTTAVRSVPRAPSGTFRITPLAESPFPEARPGAGLFASRLARTPSRGK